MERFLHRENVLLYRRLLADTNVTKDKVRYESLLSLLEAELAKDEKPPDARWFRR